MKILSCYITGFGKFSNQSFTFSDLTVIKEDNGWGKTTLAAFIRCMLFGMEAGRGKAVETNERAHYMPWQGGTYGGTMTFVSAGRQYRVERVFGRTPIQDVARVYDSNNMQCFDFGERAEKLGETLFGVDADSYGRTVYIPQGEIETGGVSEDIKTRLLALLSNGGRGETSAERALQKLDEADRKLRAKRRPAKGKLDEIDERLDELAHLKADADGNALQARNYREQARQAEQDIVTCNERLDFPDDFEERSLIFVGCPINDGNIENARKLKSGNYLTPEFIISLFYEKKNELYIMQRTVSLIKEGYSDVEKKLSYSDFDKCLVEIDTLKNGAKINFVRFYKDGAVFFETPLVDNDYYKEEYFNTVMHDKERFERS